MKFPYRPATLRQRLISIVSIVICLCLPGAAAIWWATRDVAGQTKPSARAKRQSTRVKPTPRPKAQSAPLMVPAQQREEFEEDAEKKREWFMSQRSYPDGVIPANARRLAWERRPRGPEQSLAQTWTALGPQPTNSYFPTNWGNTSGRINAIAVSPANTNLILLGSATGGIWRSTDGSSFVPVSDNQVDLGVGSIAFAPSNPSIVYAGMGDPKGGYLGSGVLKSTDAGQTWTRVSNGTLPSPGETYKIAVSPTDPNRVYLAQYAALSGSTIFSSGFFYSTDGGVNWTRTLAGLPRDLVIHPTVSSTLYLTMNRVDEAGNPSPGIYRSTDSGLTWTRIYTSPFTTTSDIRVAVTPANSQVIYVYVGGSSGSFDIRVEVSTNGGASFTNLGAPGVDRGQFGYNTYIQVSPSDANTVYLGTRDIFKSTNGGVSYVNLTNNFNSAGGYTPNSATLHPDQHSLTFLPGNPATIFAGCDGGLYKSTNGGTSFTSLNNTLRLSMFIGLTLHPTDAARTYGGTQDNGTQKRLTTGAPAAWREFATGDGGRVVVNPLNPSTVFPTYVGGVVFRYENNGDTFGAQIASDSTFGEGTNHRIAFYPPFVGNGVTSTLYFGTWRLFTSTNLGASWSAPGGTFDQTKGGGDVLSALAVSRSNNNVIYSGSAQGRAMVSQNGGVTWTDITTGLPNRFITGITVHPTIPSTAYLTVSGYGSGHVFKTTNTGASWSDVSGNLPNIPTNTLAFAPLDPNTVYAGTDVGVFSSSTGGTTWTTFNPGLPPAIVTAFATQTSGTMQLSTYGRGAYELTTTNTCPSPTAITIGQTVSGQLQSGDCVLADGSLYDQYSFTVAAGQQVAVNLNSTAFNAYLFLLDAAGGIVASDNDGGGGTNARIPSGTGFLTLGAGTYTIYANSLNSGETGAYTLTLSAPCPTINIAPAGLPGGTVGVIYSQTLSASGGNGSYTFALDSGALPTGLNLTSGVISGTPTVAGTFNFTIRATDSLGCVGTRAYTVTITGGGPCNTVTPITIGQTVGGSLSAGDCSLSGFLTDLYSFNGTVGQQIAIGLSSAQFDAFLILHSPGGLAGALLAYNDDGGGGTDARIPPNSGFITMPATGVYTIEASSFNVGETGAYSLTLTGGGTSNGLQFYPLAAPVRLLDTRPGASPNACSQPNVPIAGNTARTQPARGFCGIPATARAVTGNITTVNSDGGYLTLYPGDAQRPLVAGSNYGPNEIVNNVFTVGLGATDGTFNIYALNTTDVVVDVTGYYAPPGAGGLYFHPLPAPVRLLETRPGQLGCITPGAVLAAGSETLQTAPSTCTGIPAAARAVVGNATTVSPQTGGYLTLFPADAARPLVASSNHGAGEIVNGPFAVGLSASGQFKIFTLAQTHLVVDLLGYYSGEASDANGVGLLFTPLQYPVRLLETRNNPALPGCFKPNAPLNAAQVYTQPARGLCDGLTIPSNALGVVGNATTVGPVGGGYLTLWPSTAAQPTTATLNYNSGQVLNRHFIVGLGAADGAFRMFSQARTDLVIDLSGYFAP